MSLVEARTQAHVQRAHQRIRELVRLRTETAAAFSQNRHKIETVMRDFDRMAQAQGYAGAFDDGSRGPHHATTSAPAAAPAPAAAVLAAITCTAINPEKYNIRL